VQADTCTLFLYSTNIDAHKSAFIANLLSCTLRGCQYTAIYNTVRSHQALGYLTPQQFLRQIPSQRKE
jgi:transposase InsO family protein